MDGHKRLEQQHPDKFLAFTNDGKLNWQEIIEDKNSEKYRVQILDPFAIKIVPILQEAYEYFQEMVFSGLENFFRHQHCAH